MPKGKNSIITALNELDKKDVYSLILFALYKLKEEPEYSTLSELSYILDNDNLINLLDYYGGTTIKIPTKEEFRNVIDTLILYQQVYIEEIPFDEALKNMDSDNLNEIKENYYKISTILNNYDFRRK